MWSGAHGLLLKGRACHGMDVEVLLQLQPSRYPHKQTSWLPSGYAYVRFPGKQVVQCSLSHTHFLTGPLASYTSNYCLDHKHSLLSEILDELIVLILSIMDPESSVMKVPVLPTPALLWIRRMSILCVFLTCLMKMTMEMALTGTPWSDHPRNSETAPPEMEAYLARHFDKEVMVSQSST